MIVSSRLQGVKVLKFKFYCLSVHSDLLTHFSRVVGMNHIEKVFECVVAAGSSLVFVLVDVQAALNVEEDNQSHVGLTLQEAGEVLQVDLVEHSAHLPRPLFDGGVGSKRIGGQVLDLGLAVSASGSHG